MWFLHFRHGQHAMNMYRFTNSELADIHFIYGLADGNGRAAVRLYRERYPTRRQPNHQTFARVHQNLVERGSFRATIEGTGRRRIARTPIFEEGVLHAVDQTPGTSVRALAASTGRFPTIHRVLQGAALHPFHVQRVKSLQTDDPPRRVMFAQWFLNQIAADIHFVSSVLFCDEATFSREGGTSRTAYRCPLTYSHRMWFQQDGAPSHYARHVREHLDRTFPNRWIGRGCPVAWPPRSPDLSPLDLFLWGAMKGLVYDTPVVSKMDLVARISIAAARIRGMPGVFEDVRQSMSRRCRACIHANGRNFKHFL
ncbi:transposase-like protein [Trichonephila clavipes]|nr:transposase-like protein [Trichonephila clavipes]